MNIEIWASTAVRYDHPKPEGGETQAIQKGAAVVELHESARIRLERSYFKLGLAGTSPQMFTRSIVRDRLTQGIEKLPAGYNLIIYDAFRTIECQRALLVWMAQDAKRRNPRLTPAECDRISRQFVADPDDPDRPTVPTHNSGGAIDIGLTFDGKLVDFGTDFDEPTTLSNTDALEGPFDPNQGLTETRWMEARRNRRILFGWMRSLGFTNLSSEWWHYDLGDFLWSRQLGIPWIFETMEPMVAQIRASGTK